MHKKLTRSGGLIPLGLLMLAACEAPPPTPTPELTLLLSGQALIKKDPRLAWEDPFGSLRPIIQRADVAFTNFEMAVSPSPDRCELPTEYEVSLGQPELSEDVRPGDVRNPHAVDTAVMEFLTELGFDLMSLANNHSWDLGDCGIAATRAAAEANGVFHAGTGPDAATAGAPAYLTVDGTTFALVAATTSHDRRDLIGHAVNGVWTGRSDDWDRNIALVREAASRADFVIYYQHFQLDEDEFADFTPGDSTEDGHLWVADVAGWHAPASSTARANSVYDGEGNDDERTLGLEDGCAPQTGVLAKDKGRNEGRGRSVQVSGLRWSGCMFPPPADRFSVQYEKRTCPSFRS